MKWNKFLKNRGISSYIYCTIDDFKIKKNIQLLIKIATLYESLTKGPEPVLLCLQLLPSIEIWCRCEIDPQVVSVEKEREKVVETSKGVLLCGHVTCLMDFSLADFIPPYQAIP